MPLTASLIHSCLLTWKQGAARIRWVQSASMRLILDVNTDGIAIIVIICIVVLFFSVMVIPGVFHTATIDIVIVIIRTFYGCCMPDFEDPCVVFKRCSHVFRFSATSVHCSTLAGFAGCLILNLCQLNVFGHFAASLPDPREWKQQWAKFQGCKCNIFGNRMLGWFLMLAGPKECGSTWPCLTEILLFCL